MRTLCALLLIMTGECAFAAPLTIVEDGRPRAAIVLQPDASEQLAEAVGEMQALILRASGAELPVAEEAPPGTVAIHVGRTPAVEAMGIDLGDLDGDGFVIEFPDERTVVILGPTEWGTEFGVYEFLERYVGVRWLMPGEDGTYVPEMATIEVPDEAVRDEPAFFSRKYFGLRLPEQQLWARRNRLHSRVEFHHNLYRLFPPSDVEEHPEFFPIHGGERYFPPEGEHFRRWQPCFTAPGIVDVAVERIVQFFDEHPEAESYSLGVTDSGGHCECENCRALDPGRKNMVNRDHLTDRYITWANAVVEGVLEEHPEEWFGFLAYSEIFEPPDRVEMHPRLIPYMTYDRMQWIDPEARAAAEELTRRWSEAAGTVGWYDYIYGAAYLVPRVYPHVMAQYYRFAHENGVRGLTAEAYPNFGEGPKLYVSLKLQWDPTQDVDALLDEWYTMAVGQDAAPYVRKYYDHWRTSGRAASSTHSGMPAGGSICHSVRQHTSRMSRWTRSRSRGSGSRPQWRTRALSASRRARSCCCGRLSTTRPPRSLTREAARRRSLRPRPMRSHTSMTCSCGRRWRRSGAHCRRSSFRATRFCSTARTSTATRAPAGSTGPRRICGRFSTGHHAPRPCAAGSRS